MPRRFHHYTTAVLFFVCSAASVYTFGGCAISYQVKTQSEAKHGIDNRDGTVFRTDRQEIAAKDMYVFGDSLAYIDGKRDALNALALRDIAKIQTTERSGPALYGAAWGMGAFIAAVLYHKASGILLVPDMEIGLAISGGLGALVGAAIGREEALLINPDSLETNTFVPESRGNYLEVQRQHVKKTIHAGIDLGNYLNHKSGSHANMPGFSAGASTAVKLFSLSQSYFALGVEGNYTSITDFTLNVPQQEYRYSPDKDYVLYCTVYDEQYQLMFMDLGLFPQYVFSFNEDWSASLYVGQSYGIGMERLTPHLISQTVIDPTPRSWFWDEPPYSEYDGVRLTRIFNLGVSIYYKFLMVDVRTRQTNTISRNKMYKNVYLQLGFAL